MCRERTKKKGIYINLLLNFHRFLYNTILIDAGRVVFRIGVFIEIHKHEPEQDGMSDDGIGKERLKATVHY